MITLTAEQIKNWRKMLVSMIGPAAFTVPDSYIQAYANKMQDTIDSIKDEEDV